MADPKRALGAVGERLAADHLRRSGMTVLESNFRTRHGELSLVALAGVTLVFIDVRTRVAARTTPGFDFDAIGDGRAVRAMAAQWLGERRAAVGAPAGRELRFDRIGVTLTPAGHLVALDHLEDAL